MFHSKLNNGRQQRGYGQKGNSLRQHSQKGCRTGNYRLLKRELLNHVSLEKERKPKRYHNLARKLGNLIHVIEDTRDDWLVRLGLKHELIGIIILGYVNNLSINLTTYKIRT